MKPNLARHRRRIAFLRRRGLEILARLGVAASVVVAGALSFPSLASGQNLEPAARAALMVLFVAAFAIYLRFEQPKTYRNTRLLALSGFLAIATFAMAYLITRVGGLTEFAVPVIFGPLVLSILFDKISPSY